ncbi:MULTISPECIES: ABC transporter [unclassified Sphingobium]|uniref:Gldg family protein n=1 Tax=unclassified Sphingobium TaxID=2611147 RepID=UPI0035A6A7D8
MAALRRAFGRFLWLWLPALAIFLAGLRRAWLTGQTDPWDWSIVAALVLAGVGLLRRRDDAAFIWVALGSAGTALIFCALAAGRPPEVSAAVGLVAVALAATFTGARLRSIVGLGLLALTALLLWRGPSQPVQPVPDRPGLIVVTALPLFWDEEGRRRDAPILTLLRTRFTVGPLDDPTQLPERGARRLLLAQPRALTPAQLVAIDRWVRAGGRALVLADPMLRWPSDLPIGDRRRPPATSLLDPILARWGFAPGVQEGAEIRRFLGTGALLTLSGAYRDTPVTRRVGNGTVTLLGDADAIDDRLWLADPARPLDPRVWSADTPALLVRWLDGAPVAERRWMRDLPDVLAGVRAALLAGTIWAVMGALLLPRILALFQARAGPAQTKEKVKENGWSHF